MREMDVTLVRVVMPTSKTVTDDLIGMRKLRV
jgi:hypothetical protein